MEEGITMNISITKPDLFLLLWLVLKWGVDVWTLMLGIGVVLYAWIIIKLVIDAGCIAYLMWRLTHCKGKKITVPIKST